ncbi:MAG: tetratricopeptide repeat protein [Alphaproteobacteria bacterium]
MTPSPDTPVLATTMLETALGHHRAGRLDQAEGIYRRLLALDADHAGALHFLGVLRHQQGDAMAAEDLLRRAIAIDDTVADVHLHLGDVLRGQGRLDPAIAAFERALALDGALAEAHNNLGLALRDAGRLEEAQASLLVAQALAPETTAILSNLGLVLQLLGRMAEAEATYRQAIAITPDLAEAHGNLGTVLQRQGRLTEAVASYRQALTLRPDQAVCHSNLCACLYFHDGVDVVELLAEHRRWDECHAAHLTPHSPSHDNDRDPGRRLRVGYVGADFRRHSNSYLFEPLLSHFDRERFETVCYSGVRQGDERTGYFQGLATEWRDVAHVGDEAMAAMIRADRIDILVDLAGHFTGHRLLVLARRPAPVQAGWINITGMRALDYLFSDAVCWPDHLRSLAVETILPLPHGVFTYRPPDHCPEVAPGPATAPGAVTFGCFNNPMKIGAAAFDLWADVLRRLPASRLLFKSFTLGRPEECRRLSDLFAARGIGGDRLSFLGATSREEHLAAYVGMDIALDPTPGNGGTTTWEALWMGVPVVTLRGDRPNGRATASILTSAGLPEFIAADREAYVAIAERLAADPVRLRERRLNQRRHLLARPILDPATFVRSVEDAYREIWTRWATMNDGRHER